MAKLLYVTANPKGIEKSKGLKIGEAFLNTFIENQPDIEITRIDLFESDLVHMDADLISARGKLAGLHYTMDQLTDVEREKTIKMHEMANTFMEFDYYVFVSPLWNLNSPAVLKVYLDNLFIAGKTFAHTAEGPKGLLSGKKAIHIQTRGGKYSGTPLAELESGDRYLKIALRFLGINVMDSLISEGYDYDLKLVPGILAKATEEAVIAAAQFAKQPLHV